MMDTCTSRERKGGRERVKKKPGRQEEITNGHPTRRQSAMALGFTRDHNTRCGIWQKSVPDHRWSFWAEYTALLGTSIPIRAAT
jgi:uncharacterized cupin superfamily protein